MSEAATDSVGADWLAAMRRGDWEAAWRATDRIELPRRDAQRVAGFVRAPQQLRWDGTPPAGRSVLVRCEHGLGDTLQFMRFVPLLQAAHVHFLVQPHLVALLRDAPGLGEVRNYWTDDPLPPHDVDIEVMELAYALRMNLARLPGPYPHLHRQLPRDASLELPDEGRLRVGLVWATSDWDASRTVPLAALAPVLALKDVQFFSLQQGEAAQDPLLQRFGVERLSPRTTAIERAAAAMCALDLVICVDGMPAHLSAALGRPTWVLLKHEADWRWMEGREDTPWYPTMRLFRQPRAGHWGAVVDQLAAALRAVAAGYRRRAIAAV
ncbi:MAG TPA: hypothetical protein VFM98_18820 [Ramlibacter sp.]|uniref:hypothetical protein n=1 Tax=Ramlibacter sp. TaxID=1917967 RepID=UPI002D7F9DBA|nr:hypothetical protein [Ramlibacter sp.]HET8747659.1 hypothetical protein [Ramlibacter sp.]